MLIVKPKHLAARANQSVVICASSSECVSNSGFIYVIMMLSYCSGDLSVV